MNVLLYDRSAIATHLLANFYAFYPKSNIYQVFNAEDLPSETWVHANINFIMTTSLRPQISPTFCKFINKIILPVFIPSSKCAWLEVSKSQTKKFLQALNIPTAKGSLVKGTNIYSLNRPFVVKYEHEFNLLGRQTEIVIDSFTLRPEYEKKEVLVEEFLSGEEFSYQVICNGYDFTFFGISRDYKKYKGLNTTGIASISSADQKSIPEVDNYIKKILLALRLLGTPYKGILYLNIMKADNIYYVLEINTRFGNPETQSLCNNIESNLFSIFFLAATGNKLPKLRRNNKAGVTIQLIHKDYSELSKCNSKFPTIINLPEDITFGFQNKWSKNNIFGSFTAYDFTEKLAISKIYSYLEKLDLGDYTYKKDLI